MAYGIVNVPGDDNQPLQSKVVTPAKSYQNITPDPDYYGLSTVVVEAIPETYQDISGVTAEAKDVLAGKTIITSDGQTTAGTMANNGSATATINGLTEHSVVIPAGYTAGGTISLTDDIETALAAI